MVGAPCITPYLTKSRQRSKAGCRRSRKNSFSIPLVKVQKWLVLGINQGSFQTPFSIGGLGDIKDLLDIQ